ncbi:unnamed protein product [Clonostachys rosea f. rosea IK726]|uniref:Uncharacterized protein n=2 Tax=Bionectria ochroleuca TaxID=29856 RepID=A0A0B7KHY9_BIOOC|nr:unnamed protein product [Clonostachys rosea f. rosea IK726]
MLFAYLRYIATKRCFMPFWNWSFEPIAGTNIQSANIQYIAIYLEETMRFLGGGIIKWSADALDFLHTLQSGQLPSTSASEKMGKFTVL